MKKHESLTREDGEVRELGAQDMARMKPAAEVLPASLMTKLGVRGAQKTPTKERVSIRLSPDVVAAFRATGEGWQTRIDEALKAYLQAHRAA